jgi:maltooligosyltrehalose trehalohydrolase
MKRRRPIGAEVMREAVHFRVWAPARRSVAAVLASGEHPLQPEGGGYFSGLVREKPGALYRFRLDGGETFPDPASRFQPEGPHGPSQIVDPSSYRRRDAHWRGVPLQGAVISEIHIGTFTPEGTYAAAAAHLPDLADAGINVVEVMPLHEFPGRFGWGYDGVDLWAPTRLYGSPDDLRAFVDEAHQHGVAVILDVVYNHFGPDGCYLSKFAPDYFTKEYENDWGAAVNFSSPGVREFVAQNAAYWIDEFHFDGLRLDATQSIFDESTPNIMAEIAACARGAAPDRTLLIVGENEPQDVKLLDVFGLDALWNDDWHHAAHVALTRQREAYYTDYCGAPQEFVSMARFGFLYQGQWYSWQKQPRGTPSTHLAPRRLIAYLDNHDQVANSARGARIHQIGPPHQVLALTALMLLQPQTPMLFQGQEFAASAPFLYFADHNPELARMVRKGRHDFLRQFPSLAAIRDTLAVPDDPRTFEACKLDWSERRRNNATLTLYRDLIRLRRTDPVLSQQRSDILHGAVLGRDAFVLRWMPGDGEDRLLIINLRPDLEYAPLAEPLLGPPLNRTWRRIWSSADQSVVLSQASDASSDSPSRSP